MVTNYIKNFIKKIKSKKIIVGIVGLGYVGLPLAKAFSEKKIKVMGFDLDRKKILKLKSGKSYLNYYSNTVIQKMRKNGFEAFNAFKNINRVDVIVICLPTPLKKNLSPEMKFIKNSMKTIAPYLKKGQAISLESTTYPGTSKEILLPYLSKFKVGKDFFLIYSPEREDPGNKLFPITKVPKVLGGYTTKCRKIGSKIYSLLKIKIVEVSSLEIAEFTKLLENIYRSVNIGMINEIKKLTLKMNLNIFEIIKAAKTKPFGFQAFYPGPGYGGHCIPIDPFYLTWLAKRYNFNTKFIKLSGKVNNEIPISIVKTLRHIIKDFKNKKILILGVAYKKNVDDLRESPALKIIQLLIKYNIKFDFMDPYIKIIQTRNIKSIYKAKKINYKNLKSYSISLLVTDHDWFDYKKILKNSNLILDCRGKFAFSKNPKIIQV